MNKVPKFAIDLGPAALIAGLAAPLSPKSSPMPANNSFRADNGDGTCDTREQPVQPDE
jgi:hypothetical protein